MSLLETLEISTLVTGTVTASSLPWTRVRDPLQSLCFVPSGMSEEIEKIKGDIKELQDEIQEQKDNIKLYREKIEGFGANAPGFMWRHLTELHKFKTELVLERAALRRRIQLMELAALRPQHQGGIIPPCSPCLGTHACMHPMHW